MAVETGDIAPVAPQIQPITIKNVQFKGVQIQVPRDIRNICRNGWVGPDDVHTATAEWGEKMLTTIADYIAEFIEAFKDAPLV